MFGCIFRARTLHPCWSLIALLFLAGSAVAQWGAPTVETLSGVTAGVQKEVGPHSIAVSTAGFLNVVWTESRPLPPGGHWILTTDNHYGGSWGAPDTVNTADQVAFNPVIAVSPVNHWAYIAYEANDTLFLAYHLLPGWFRLPIATAPLYLCCPTIDVDDSGVVHLAWIGEADFVEEFHIGYATVTDSVVTQLLIHTGLGVFGLGAAPSLTATPNGAAHITYRNGDYEDYHIVHTCNTGLNSTEWSEVPLFTSNQEDLTSQIIADDLDLHAVVCGDDGWGMPAHLYYFYKPARGVWSQPELVSGTYNAVGGTIAVDPSGGPHILSMERSGNLLTGNILYSEIQPNWMWATNVLVGTDYYNPFLVISPNAYGHVMCNTGGTTGNYSIRHLCSQNPLALLPHAVVAPDTLRYGQVRVGLDSTRILGISNEGQAPLVVDTIICSHGFFTEFTTYPAIIEPAQALYITVTFAPTQALDYEGSCDIYSNDPADITSIPLYGSGAINLDPTPFARALPADSSIDPWWQLPYVRFVWNSSSDPEGAVISYQLHVYIPDDPPPWEYNLATQDTSALVEIPLPVLDEPTEFRWTVHATDGFNTINASNGTGVFFIMIEAAEDPPALTPSSFALTAYPNPFNPTATIQYHLPQAGEVSLRVFDVTGRVVSELARGYQTAGQYTIHFDGAALPTGIYFARLETGSAQRTYKLMLLK